MSMSFPPMFSASRDAPPHGGHRLALARQAGCSPEEIDDFSANLNPLGPSDTLRDAVIKAWPAIVDYPPPRAEPLVAALADQLETDARRLVMGNGSTELLYAFCRAVAAVRRSAKQPFSTLLLPPCYGDYRRAALLADADIRVLPRRPEDHFRVDFAALRTAVAPGDLVIAGAPNNPDGSDETPEAWLSLARDCPETLFLVDEAFAGFVRATSPLAVAELTNLATMHSLTKLHAIPGLRLGYMALPSYWADALRAQLPPWSVGALEMAAGLMLASSAGDAEYRARTRICVSEWRKVLSAALAALPGLEPFPGAANFLLVRISNPDVSVPALARRLLREHHIAIRIFTGPDDPGAEYFRIAVRTPPENARLIEALARVLDNRP